MPPQAAAVAKPVGTILAQSSDTFVAYRARRRLWEIAAPGIHWQAQFVRNKGYRLNRLRNPQTGTEWLAATSATPAFKIVIGDETITSLSDGWTLLNYAARIQPNQSVELEITLARGAFKTHLHHVTFPGTGFVEQWAVVENAGNATLPALAALDDIMLPLKPSAENLTLYWVQGLDPPGGNVGDPPRVANLKLRSLELTEGISHDLFSTRRSSEENIGWFALHAPNLREGIVGGIEWSGAWWLRASRANTVTSFQAIAEDFRRDLAPGESFETPHRFLGFFEGDLDSAANVTHAFVRQYLMRPQPANFPWAHFNTWFAYYVNLNEETLRREVDVAAELGLEAFCVDAGWYAGSPNDVDFSFGLGTWRENRDKFPSGLAAFADYVHGKGMKFGLWVEPERADLKYAGPGTEIPLEWFSPRTPFDAAPPPDLPQSSRIWLGNPAAVEWMKGWLTRIVQEYHVDWLKWDNNLWLSCDPPGETRDAEYAHVRGLYEVFDFLRAQFPALVIENCASGGHRMDFGLLRRTDVQWLADDTEPGFRVRHYMAGASFPFPPEYLNAWIVESWFEHLGEVSEPGILRAWLRSRMMGAFGISRSLLGLDAGQRAVIAEEIARCKNLRPILKNSQVYRLFPQTELLAPPLLQAPADPDAVEFYDPASRSGVVFLFQGAAAWDNRVVILKGLAPETVYQIESADRSISEQKTGEQLMTEGIGIGYDAGNPSAIISIKGM